MTTIAEKWVEKGIEKRDSEIVVRMAKNGLSDAQIRDLTGLSIKRIQQIRSERGKEGQG